MEPWLKKTIGHTKGFTLVELLVALVVTGIILSAVTTLAFAMSNASRISDDTVVKQAQLRQARLRIGELIHNCRLICAAPENDLAVWQADSNGDGQININELVYIERGDGLDTLRLCQFSPADSGPVTLQSLAVSTTKGDLISQCSEVCVPLIPACTRVQFHFDAAPPLTRRLTISLRLVENGMEHAYEITAGPRAWAGNLLSGDGTTVVGDDD